MFNLSDPFADLVLQEAIDLLKVKSTFMFISPMMMTTRFIIFTIIITIVGAIVTLIATTTTTMVLIDLFVIIVIKTLVRLAIILLSMIE